MAPMVCVAETLPLPDAVLSKLCRLAGGGDLHLLAPTYYPALDRFYFFSGEPRLRALAEQRRGEVETELERAGQRLTEAGVRVHLRSLDQRDWIGPTLRALQDVGGWLALTRPDAGQLPAHTWTLIHQCPEPTLLLGARAWQEVPRVAGGVDPTHRDDRPLSSDQKIIRSTRALAERCQSHDWQLWHCAYVAPVAREYRRQILGLHQQALRELADTTGVSHRRCQLLEGAPSERLPREARARDLDLLVMGTTARGAAGRWITGSTVTAVLPKLDCDLCLVNTSPLPHVQ